VSKDIVCKDVTVRPQINAWMPLEFMEHGLGCVCEHLPGALSKQWMHFVAIFPTESEIG
jgi:hypothetical protein